MPKRKKKPQMKLGFMIPAMVEQLSKEDPKQLKKIPVLHKAVQQHMAGKCFAIKGSKKSNTSTRWVF